MLIQRSHTGGLFIPALGIVDSEMNVIVCLYGVQNPIKVLTRRKTVPLTLPFPKNDI